MSLASLTHSRLIPCWIERWDPKATMACSPPICTPIPLSSTQDVAIVASAQARGVPVVSGRQLLEWLDGRNSSSFGAITWSGGVLAFTVFTAPGARNLQGMVPTISAGGVLTGIILGASPVAYTIQRVKGVEYAFFAASNGTYQVSYAPKFIDTTVVDFSAGTPDATTYIAQTVDSEVTLAPTFIEDFSGMTLPPGWSSALWTNAGSANAGNGQLLVDGAVATTTSVWAPGRSLEFVATFNAAPSQHAGFTSYLQF